VPPRVEPRPAPEISQWAADPGRAWGGLTETRRVLIVDDDAALLTLMRILLATSGYQVELAHDGLEALSLLAGNSYDVIILDLEMPRMNGRAFFREYRLRGGEAPILLVSAYGAEEATRELGAQGFVSKPFEPDNLVRKIETVLSGR